MNDPQLEHRTAIARRLNRGGVSAAPLARLSALSIFDDEEYENYDLDLVSPLRRRKIAKLLTAGGFRQRTGRTFEAPAGGEPVVFPKPGTLGSDPSRPAAELLARGGAVVLVTPTQAVLLVLHHLGDQEPATLAEELNALVWEQPANLDKVADWARAAGRRGWAGRSRSSAPVSRRPRRKASSSGAGDASGRGCPADQEACSRNCAARAILPRQARQETRAQSGADGLTAKPATGGAAAVGCRAPEAREGDR